MPKQKEKPKITKKQKQELRKQEKLEKKTQRKRKQFLKKILLWLLVLLAIGGLVLGLKNFSSNSQNQSSLSLETVSPSDWVKGDKEAKILLIEYSDFQCPACKSYHPWVGRLLEEFESETQFVYRHFPLRSIHQNAELAARVAEAAGKQGKFWQMHDILFEKQDEWAKEKNSKEIFLNYAQDLGLNKEEFKKDLESKEVKDKVNNDYSSGIKVGVNATPTFFLKGAKIQNPRSYEEFVEIIKKGT